MTKWSVGPLTALGLVVVFATVVVLAVVASKTTQRTQTYFDGLSAAQDLASLRATSEVIAIVRPSGRAVSHWNSRDNAPWVAKDGTGVIPMIVTDQEVVVERAWRGASPGEVLSIRTVGGIVGPDEFHDADSVSLDPSSSYLVFLRRDDWVGGGVVDNGVLSPVGRGQGVLGESGPAFTNHDGLTVTPEALDRTSSNTTAE